MKIILLAAILAAVVWAENHLSFNIESILVLTLP